MPIYVPLLFSKEIYSAGIALMAVVFSVVFGTIAVIASGGDSTYIAFLEEDSGFSKLLDSFRTTLNLLFAALMLSLVEFGYAVLRLNAGMRDQSKLFLTVFVFALLYALIASRLVANDAIMFAKNRAIFAADEARMNEGTSPTAKRRLTNPRRRETIDKPMI